VLETAVATRVNVHRFPQAVKEALHMRIPLYKLFSWLLGNSAEWL
jgi:hypothetical protein